MDFVRLLETTRGLIESLGGGIVVVNLLVHFIKIKWIAPELRGRWTQAIVLILSIGMSSVVVGVADFALLVKTAAEIFAGAVALDQVTSKTSRGAV